MMERFPPRSKTAAAFLHHQQQHPNQKINFLQLLALNALELTAPVSSTFLRVFHDKDRAFVQVSGHPGILSPAGPNTLWKKQARSVEAAVYAAVQNDLLAAAIPRFYSKTSWEGDDFIEIQDLLTGFGNSPAVCDLKMGSRTFLEDEVNNPKLRPDLYSKMILIDPNYPTQEERDQAAVTKLRYMQFREKKSTTTTHGFRLEAIKFLGSPEPSPVKAIEASEVVGLLGRFLTTRKLRKELRKRIKWIRSLLESSDFFSNHEVIGSSVLIVHDGAKVGAWLIDFAKTNPSPVGRLDHRSSWQIGNHEDGYLKGIDNLLLILDQLCSETNPAKNSAK